MDNNKWDEIIQPQTSLFNLRLKELWRYRDLVMMFVKRDFVSVYKQTILGPLWYIIQPLLTTLMFYVIFGRLARLSTDGLPPVLFYLAGITAWNYFAECLNQTSNTFITNAHIFGKVYFSRLSVPVSVVISRLITFGIQFALFIVVLLIYYAQGIEFNANGYFLILPLLLLIMALLGLGLGIIVSSLTTKYRDLRYLVTFGVQLFMYATPVIYPLSTITSPKAHLVLMLNPMTAIIEAMRFSFLGAGHFSWSGICYSLAFSVVVFLFGVVLFNRIERTFMDTV